ncbi:DUF4932 domain-containing protein [Romboutsia weinsteinii]|uniref:DUF4932 domain-containing protein n=2 Tax=Romboutsia weinsteinii TaxID=2020949 RepID=A0A371J226_9FIRM|nr:DUF4932 domain-containing protein [Romboutsia weinsteinii]
MVCLGCECYTRLLQLLVYMIRGLIMRGKKVISFFLGTMMCFLVGCTSSNTIEVEENKTLSKDFNNINIMIDPRIELLSVIFYLSPTYNNETSSIIPEDISYKKDVEKYFKEYKDHKAVKMFELMYKEGFAYDAPPTSMLFLTNTPVLKIKENIDKDDYMYTQCMERAGGEDRFIRFIEELNKFCEESNFYDFYNKHIDYYNKILDNTIKGLKDVDYISQMEEYYGKKQNSYNIILSGMLYANNYGPRIKDTSGNFDIYSIQGSFDIEDDLPKFDDEEFFKYLVRHEFGHSFVNPVTTDNIDTVNKYENLYTPIESEMKKQAYSNWDTSLNEHIVRAVVIRMTEINDGKNEAEKYIDKERKSSFIYIDDIVNLLKDEYEPNRDKYSTFEDFYPNILKLLDDLSKK